MLKINLKDWISYLLRIQNEYKIFAPFRRGEYIDFNIVENNFSEIVYNSAKTLLPLKHFFFPLKENVTSPVEEKSKVLIIGAKNCDLAGLQLLDNIFLNDGLFDEYYKNRRDNTIIIGTDCYQIDENCHCMAYGLNPYPEKLCDIVLNRLNDKIIFESFSEKGKNFIDDMRNSNIPISEAEEEKKEIDNIRSEVKKKFLRKIRRLPDQLKTAQFITKSSESIWKKYSEKCVSCGACVICCPTCHCFILIDTPKFDTIEKIRLHDACQYPGFAKVAAGVDPLEKHSERFKNRYECKFIRRPEKFNVTACTGCGRCIEVCIGKINKNEVIMDIAR